MWQQTRRRDGFYPENGHWVFLLVRSQPRYRALYITQPCIFPHLLLLEEDKKEGFMVTCSPRNDSPSLVHCRYHIITLLHQESVHLTGTATNTALLMQEEELGQLPQCWAACADSNLMCRQSHSWGIPHSTWRRGNFHHFSVRTFHKRLVATQKLIEAKENRRKTEPLLLRPSQTTFSVSFTGHSTGVFPSLVGEYVCENACAVGIS